MRVADASRLREAAPHGTSKETVCQDVMDAVMNTTNRFSYWRVVGPIRSIASSALSMRLLRHVRIAVYGSSATAWRRKVAYFAAITVPSVRASPRCAIALEVHARDARASS